MVNSNHNKNICNQFAKLPKINGQTSITTEVGRYLLYLKKSNLPKMCFLFFIFFFFIFLSIFSSEKIKNKRKHIMVKKISMKIIAHQFTKLAKITCQTSVATEADRTYHILKTDNLPKIMFFLFCCAFFFPLHFLA